MAKVEAARHKRDRQRLEGRLETLQSGRSDLGAVAERIQAMMDMVDQTEARSRSTSQMVRHGVLPRGSLDHRPCFYESMPSSIYWNAP